MCEEGVYMVGLGMKGLNSQCHAIIDAEDFERY